MKKEVGFVQNCDLESGNIITEDKVYFFFNTDIEETVRDNDAVEFQYEQKQKVKRAYFVRKIGTTNIQDIRN